MTSKNHMRIGWIYFFSAWMSLFVVNGIITFMLTPGEWLNTGSIWDGFFNPTFWPSLFIRTGICIMLAGLYSLAVISLYRPSDFKVRVVRYNAVWGLLGLAVTLPSLYWYWNAIPLSITEKAIEMMATPMLSIELSYWLAGVIALILVLFGIVLPARQHITLAVITLVLGLVWFGSFEWFRESVRKPYAISGYMYGNGIELSKKELYQKEGYLKYITFRTGDDGADLFRRACRSCHTLDGYKPLKPAFNGTDKEFIAGIIKGAHVITGNMPQFLGNDDEAYKLADYIYGKIDSRHMSEIYNMKGMKLGRKVFDIRCGKCHVFGGYNDNSGSLTGLEDEDYHDILDSADEFADEMPPFTGDALERQALIEYLKTLEEEDGE